MVFPIEVFRPTLEKAVAILQLHHIRFHLTGGVISIAYGEPRMTLDIAKLIWISKGSHKSRRDLRQLVRTSNEVQFRAIRELAATMDLNDLLDAVLAESDEIEP